MQQRDPKATAAQGRGTSRARRRLAAPAAASAASSRVAAASSPFIPQVESAADSLRKVQLALSGGTAEDDLVAATTLETGTSAGIRENPRWGPSAGSAPC